MADDLLTTGIDAPLPIAIEDEMRRAYLDYAMSVIISRAIPDARDGLKPVHRRILYAMMETGCDWNKPFRKSARIVGEVMGKYHPHGDSAIYDALVRMAQPFSMRLMLIDGQGNFGSMDGDSAAAMRYTESRLSKAAHQLLEDIDKNTVDFGPNYDGSEIEPQVLPAAFPNLLVNGAGGIAVGMATNIPTHNLGEVIDATILLIKNPEASIDDIMEVMPGPDFPTGGLILGRAGIRSAFHTGRGSVIMRGKTEIEEMKGGKSAIIITEVPYQVNKARMIERIAELVRDKKIEGITDLRDESDKQGIRVVIEVKREAHPEIILNQLYTFTPLQTSFGVNMLALNHGQPEQLDIKKALYAFIEFREEVITRRTLFLLNKARDRAHILIGLGIAVANIDEVVKLIRQSPDPVAAKEALMAKSWDAGDILPLLKLVDDKGNKIEKGKLKFTETQAKAILELRLQRLTGLERQKIEDELKELGISITDYLSILASRERRFDIMTNELTAIRQQFATPRRTSIEDQEFDQDIEDLIPREDMVVTVTVGGYIKRTPLATYRAQRRGGKGKTAMAMREEDATTEMFVASTHAPVLFFSSTGKVYRLKVYKLPVGTAQSKGRALVNLLPLGPGETIQNFMPLPEDAAEWEKLHILFATRKGNIRRNDLSDFHNIQSNGKIAIRLDDGDKLVSVLTCDPSDHVMLSAKSGKCIRFPVEQVRVFKSRTSDGVRGMKLQPKDEVISMSILSGIKVSVEERYSYLRKAAAKRRAHGDKDEDLFTMEGEEGGKEIALTEARYREMEAAEQFILTITENGYGKRSSAYEYRVTGRGGSGIVNIIASARNGKVIASFPVDAHDDLMLMATGGKIIRTPVSDIRIAGRNTQGVTIFKTGDGEKVTSASIVREESDETEAS